MAYKSQVEEDYNQLLLNYKYLCIHIPNIYSSLVMKQNCVATSGCIDTRIKLFILLTANTYIHSTAS